MEKRIAGRKHDDLPAQLQCGVEFQRAAKLNATHPHPQFCSSSARVWDFKEQWRGRVRRRSIVHAHTKPIQVGYSCCQHVTRRTSWRRFARNHRALPVRVLLWYLDARSIHIMKFPRQLLRANTASFAPTIEISFETTVAFCWHNSAATEQKTARSGCWTVFENLFEITNSIWPPRPAQFASSATLCGAARVLEQSNG